ncbi:hypothetical protein TrLO_g11011 [Triparma laevis f. longispina]|uniref:Nucleotide-diphospho-sugar transferase domain-containing protein n=1 Tax=Triparma laevis f. longispina TaxID=1714387 RepID=A0A9W7F5A7_9STRA|nr:hypothetical protein TrLO_g11011 [Triparma laevis f. longispina]
MHILDSNDYSNFPTETYPRLHALKLSSHLIHDSPSLHTLLSQTAIDNNIIILMANSGHSSLTSNALNSLKRLGIKNVILFGLDSSTCTSPYFTTESSINYPCYHLPSTFLQSLCGSCGLKNVWSSGFADVAVIKPTLITSLLSLNYNVLWTDTDVVFTVDPFGKIRGGGDVAIQAGGTNVFDKNDWKGSTEAEIYFRDELCTGFYYVKSSPQTIKFFTQTVLELSLHSDDVKFGDQSSFNLVMFEWMFRDEVGLSVDILNPTEFPTGSLFFDHHNSVYKDNGEIVFMVHNNFIIGSEKKVERFKKYNMWLEDSYLKNLDYSSTEFKVLGQSVPTLKLGELSIVFQKPEVGEDYFEVYKNQPVLMYVNDDLPVEEQRERVIVSISTGGRKWFDLYVLPRLKDYAVKTRSSILLVRRQTECDRFNDVVYDSWKDSRRETVDEKPGGERSFDDDDYLYHDCVKAGKVRVWGEVLKHFKNVLYVDDTVLISRNALDIFDSVGENGLGVVGEGGVRPASENEAFMRVVYNRYSNTSFAPYNDELKMSQLRNFEFFNSGVVVFNRDLHLDALIDSLPAYVNDPTLKRDQGFANNLAFTSNFHVVYLDFKWNYMGSFVLPDGTGPAEHKKHLVDYEPKDAYFVHLTTGVNGNIKEKELIGSYNYRTEIFRKIDEAMP